MTQENPKIFIIIPAWNEEKNISPVLSSLIKNYENIVIVDDGSSDKTIEIAKQFPVTILKHIINRGQGASLQTGNEYAISCGADMIIHFDADGQFQISDIPKFINELKNGYDIVYGSRFLDNSSQLPWMKKNILFPIARIINKIFFKVTTSDPQSGFRAMTKNTAEKWIKIEHDEMAHCSEILHKSFKYNLKIKEVPITVKYHNFGQNLSGGTKILKDLIIKKILK